MGHVCGCRCNERLKAKTEDQEPYFFFPPSVTNYDESRKTDKDLK